MKNSMSVEKEGQDSKREQKISNPAKELYQAIVDRIKKLLNIQDKQPNEEQELQELKNERARRLELLKSINKPYFDKIQRTKIEIGNIMQRAIAGVGRASANERQAKIDAAKKVIKGQEDFAWQIGEQEPDLPWDLRGVGRVEVGEFIANERVNYDQALRMSPAQVGLPEGNAADLSKNKDIRKEIEKQTAQLRKYGFSEEVAKRYGEDMILHPASYYGYSATELEIIKTPGKEGARAREDMFDDIFAIVDSQPSVSFHEALSQNTMYKLNQFFEVLKELPGSKQLIDEYGTKQKLRMMLHNSAYLVEHGGGKPEQFEQMMEQFTPELFDQLFMYPEVGTAVHLYEIGVETFRSRNDNFLPWEQMVYNPKKGLNEIDTWVMERFKEVVRKKHTPHLSEEEFREQWSEKKIMKTLALARGFEITTVRFQEMSARGRLPKGSDSLTSPPYEDFVRPLDPFEHFTEKFLSRDPGAAWLLFTITDGAILPDASEQDIDDYFNKKGIDPQHLHMMDIVNFLETGGPFTSSWRSQIAMRNISEEDKKWMGLSFGKYLIEEETKDLPEEEKKTEKERRLKALFEKTLERNPIRILREAELQDGEIMDYDVQAMVLEETLKKLYGGAELEEMIKKYAAKRLEGETNEQFGERITRARKNSDRDDFIAKAEDVLIVLTQIELDKKEGKIEVKKLEKDEKDPLKEARAIAYFEAIKIVVTTRKRKWLKENKVIEKKEGITASLFGDLYKEKNPKQEIQETSIMEYLCQKKFPFTPGFDDTPFNKPDFIKMGQKGFSRRIRDYMGAHKAMMAMLEIQNNFGKLRKGEQVVGALDKFWGAIREYDKNLAKVKMMKLYEGICKFNAANKPRRFLPFPLDVVNEFLSNSHWFGFKPTSYARDKFGYAANSWRGVDMYNLLGMARMAGHITSEQEMELRKKLRCDVGNLMSEYACRGWLVGVVFIAGLWVQEALKQIQEQSKEA